MVGLLESGLDQYRKDYAAYYADCKHANSPAMRDPNPTVVLIPGVGMIAFGKNKSESRVTAEFYTCAVEVMWGAEAVSQYVALPRQEAFDIEYWLLEEAKLKRMPPEKTLERNAVIVIGAGSGIGKAAAERVAKEGAHVVCADLSLEAAQATADELTKIYGIGIGVAGTGISGCGPAIGLGVDITDRASVRALLDQVLLAYGGIDNIIVTAGVFVPPDKTGHISDERWRLTFDVNVLGGYLVADEARAALAGAESTRIAGADDQRQRRRLQEGIARLRHQQSRRQSPRPRTGGRTRAAGARQRVRSGDGGRGQQHVPARPGDQFAGQVQHRLQRETKTPSRCGTSWRIFMPSAR